MRASARKTAGEQPTVFSLKSRRSFLARPSSGASYGASPKTALRTGTIGSFVRFTGAPRHAPSGAQGGDARGEPLQSTARNFLRARTFHEVRDAQAAARASPS